MTTPAFSRDDPDDWDDGWSRVPHGLWTLKLPAGALVLLGWLHSHTPSYLSGVTMTQARKAVGSSSIYSWFDALEEAGYVTVERGDNGKAARVTLLAAPWRALLGRRDQSEIGSVTSPKSARTEEQGEDHPSSLRSEDESQTQERTQQQVAADVATAYWDWYKQENNDRKPTIAFLALRGVAFRLLKSGYADNDIVDAMKTAKAWTAKALAGEIDRKKHEAEQRPTTVAIPHSLVKAFAAAEPFLNEHGLRWPGLRHAVMTKCASAMSVHGFDVGETMVRLAIVMRDLDGVAQWTADELYLRLLRVDMDRFAGNVADYPDAMRRAYTNRYWRVS